MSNQDPNRKRRENRPTDSFGGPNSNNRVSLTVALIALGFFLFLQVTNGNLGGILTPASSGEPTSAAPANTPSTPTQQASAAATADDKEEADETDDQAQMATPAIVEATATSEAQAGGMQTPRATIVPSPTANAPPTNTPQTRASNLSTIAYDDLPPEAHDTIALIEQGGPFPYSRDGITFQNRERILPRKAEGYYREYTVITPGASTRGAKRIVTGQDGEMYYTDDHYESFSEIIR